MTPEEEVVVLRARIAKHERYDRWVATLIGAASFLAMFL